MDNVSTHDGRIYPSGDMISPRKIQSNSHVSWTITELDAMAKRYFSVCLVFCVNRCVKCVSRGASNGIKWIFFFAKYGASWSKRREVDSVEKDRRKVMASELERTGR